MNEKTLFQALQEAGIKIEHHESDLYFPVSEKSTEILNQFPLQEKNKTFFFNVNDDCKKWYDIPFAYDPYWESKEA